jgi:hypothetical protein
VFYRLIASSSDADILLAGVVAVAVLALAVAVASQRLLFSQHDKEVEAHGKLAEVVHNSLLAFSVFVLALVLTEVRANLGKADDLELREASLIARLTRDLTTLGGESAAAAGERVREYVRSAVSAEWTTLAQHEPALAEETSRAMASLVTQIHRLEVEHPPAASTLRAHVEKLEELRLNRLEFATKAVPPVFWWVIGVFIAGAMIMNGRHNLDAFSMMLIAFHMGAIGLIIATILVMDSPFRGQTSVSPTALLRAAGVQ